MSIYDTIMAIATPPGEGGIGIIRISGELAPGIAEKIFKPKKATFPLKSHHLYVGHVLDPENNEAIDEVLLTIMHAPRTYTREDVVEINCHGGIIPLKRTLDLVSRQGARLAEPGEFTKRAFLNGRLDLAQAEGLLQIIRAKTDVSLKAALNQLEGTLSRQVTSIRQELLYLLAGLEAAIDFPEEGDVADVGINQVKEKTAKIKTLVDELLRESERGKIYREGIETAIIGRPNVGKSSLLNALLKEQRAIVTEVPGTTRDVLEEYVNVGGIPLKIIDTAGIRKTVDQVEVIGVKRARDLAQRADLIIFMLNAAEALTEEDREIAGLLRDQNTLVVLNKTDLEEKISREEVLESVGKRKLIAASLIEGKGLRELEDAIYDLVFSGRVEAGRQDFISSTRQKHALARASHHLAEVLGAEIKDPDLASIDLQEAYAALGEITGETVGEDILDTIFAEFCIGK